MFSPLYRGANDIAGISSLSPDAAGYTIYSSLFVWWNTTHISYINNLLYWIKTSFTLSSFSPCSYTRLSCALHLTVYILRLFDLILVVLFCHQHRLLFNSSLLYPKSSLLLARCGYSIGRLYKINTKFRCEIIQNQTY